MIRNLIMLLVFSANFCGCATIGGASKSELEKRAGYGQQKPQKVAPSRKSQRVEKVYIGGRMLTSGDWFIGGWASLVIEEANWVFDDPRLKKITQ